MRDHVSGKGGLQADFVEDQLEARCQPPPFLTKSQRLLLQRLGPGEHRFLTRDHIWVVIVTERETPALQGGSRQGPIPPEEQGWGLLGTAAGQAHSFKQGWELAHHPSTLGLQQGRRNPRLNESVHGNQNRWLFSALSKVPLGAHSGS